MGRPCEAPPTQAACQRGVRGPARRMETSPAPGSLWFLSPAGKELVRPQTHETLTSCILSLVRVPPPLCLPIKNIPFAADRAAATLRRGETEPLRPLHGHLPFQGRLLGWWFLPLKGSTRKARTSPAATLRCGRRNPSTRFAGTSPFRGGFWGGGSSFKRFHAQSAHFTRRDLAAQGTNPSARFAGTSPFRGGFWCGCSSPSP